MKINAVFISNLESCNYYYVNPFRQNFFQYRKERICVPRECDMQSNPPSYFTCILEPGIVCRICKVSSIKLTRSFLKTDIQSINMKCLARIYSPIVRQFCRLYKKKRNPTIPFKSTFLWKKGNERDFTLFSCAERT